MDTVQYQTFHLLLRSVPPDMDLPNVSIDLPWRNAKAPPGFPNPGGALVFAQGSGESPNTARRTAQLSLPKPRGWE